jgi:hypothetical protein
MVRGQFSHKYSHPYPIPITKYANKIEAYAPELFSLFGIKGQSEKLFTTAIFGAVKFVASLLCAILLIDHVGRKRSLISGILVQQVAMWYIAIYLTVNASLAGAESPSTKRAALGSIIFIYFVGIGWAMGWNSIQYLLNAEIFPLRVRATGSSLLMCFHYVNRYGLSKVSYSRGPMNQFLAIPDQDRLFHPCYCRTPSVPKGHFGFLL